MKLLQILLFISIGLTVMTACRKDQDAPNSVAGIAGIYEGKYGTGTNEPFAFYSFQLKEDGTLEELNNTGVVVGRGTWNISGKSFSAKYNYLSSSAAAFTLRAIYDAPERTMIGTWGYDNSHNDGGIWHMTRKY